MLQTISTALVVVVLGLGAVLHYRITSTSKDIDVCAKRADGMTVEQCHRAVHLARSAGD